MEKEAKELLMALEEVFNCLENDNDIKSAIANLNVIKERLRVLLPACGVYAWVFEGMDKRRAMTFSSVKEAEEQLNRDVNETIIALEDMDGACTVPHKDTLKKYGDFEITVKDGYDVVSWKRMYHPDELSE